MLNPATIANGVITGIATESTLSATSDFIKKITGLDDPPSAEDVMIALLAQLHNDLAPQERFNYDESFALQGYPYDVPIDENWRGFPHVCMFFGVSTALRVEIEGIGAYLKTVGPGWVLLDVRGRISTSDASTKNVILSYRYDPIGVAL